MATIENSGARLQTQSDLGRTSSGRYLREGMAELSKAAVGGQDKPLADCRGCAFLSSSDDFSAGCPNCGCKDFDLLDIEKQIVGCSHVWQEVTDSQFSNETHTEVRCVKCGMAGEKTIASGQVFFPAT